MSIPPISLLKQGVQSQVQSPTNQFQGTFQQLAAALKSGDLAGAQAAFAKLQHGAQQLHFTGFKAQS